MVIRQIYSLVEILNPRAVEDDDVLPINIRLKGDAKDLFELIKDDLAIESNADVFRHIQKKYYEYKTTEKNVLMQVSKLLQDLQLSNAEMMELIDKFQFRLKE